MCLASLSLAKAVLVIDSKWNWNLNLTCWIHFGAATADVTEWRHLSFSQRKFNLAAIFFFFSFYLSLVYHIETMGCTGSEGSMESGDNNGKGKKVVKWDWRKLRTQSLHSCCQTDHIRQDRWRCSLWHWVALVAALHLSESSVKNKETGKKLGKRVNSDSIWSLASHACVSFIILVCSLHSKDNRSILFGNINPCTYW